MQKVEHICDGCCASFKESELKAFYSEKYQRDVDLCRECVDLLVTYTLKTAAVLGFCKVCRGSGTVDGERIDSPCCGENRPEYSTKPCPDCCEWKKCGK